MDAILHTERLTVRLWTLEDADTAYSIYSDPDIARYLPGGAHPSPEATRAWLEQRLRESIEATGLGFWALVEQESGEIIGGVMLAEQHLGSQAHVQVGFHLGDDAYRQGYADEIADALVRYGFDDLALDHIVGVALPDDLVSRRVLEKLGMVDADEGLFGEPRDGLMAIHQSLEEGRGPIGVPS